MVSNHLEQLATLVDRGLDPEALERVVVLKSERSSPPELIFVEEKLRLGDFDRAELVSQLRDLADRDS